ncbi:ThuA domain-containing protein [Bacillus nitroreducens]
MKRIVVLLGDYYHSYEHSKASVNRALELLNAKEKFELIEIQSDQLTKELERQPDAVILFKENRVNPTDKKVENWMTEEISQAICQYVKRGGGWLAWHSGLASYSVEGAYIEMLRGYFEYHPENHSLVKYSGVQGEDIFGSISFEIEDEHYFVNVKEGETNIFLKSDSEEGNSIGGWYHNYGRGRVCCLVPAHTYNGLLNENVTGLLAKTIKWVSC